MTQDSLGQDYGLDHSIVFSVYLDDFLRVTTIFVIREGYHIHYVLITQEFIVFLLITHLYLSLRNANLSLFYRSHFLLLFLFWLFSGFIPIFIKSHFMFVRSVIYP